jgi:hypothetical protein
MQVVSWTRVTTGKGGRCRLQGLIGDSQERLGCLWKFCQVFGYQASPFPKRREPLSVSTSSSTTPLPKAWRRTVTLKVFSLLLHFTPLQNAKHRTAFRFVTKQFCLFRLFPYRFETLKQTENFYFRFHETNRNKPKQTRNRSCFG